MELSTIPQASTALAAIESSRAIQEVQASLVIAKKFPRDEKRALDRIVNACTRPGLAAQSQYQFARGGTDISGPSIRLAETIAQHWGNIEHGFKELARGVENNIPFSEVEAYAWDKETNSRVAKTFTVRHWRDTKKGGYAIKDERDIYELIANQAQRRVRACILSVIPGDVVEDAVNQCNVTLKASADVTPEAIKKLVAAFDALDVSKKRIEAKIQRRLDSITPAQVVQLRKIYTSIKDGMSSADDWFDPEETVAPAPDPFAGDDIPGVAKKPNPAPKQSNPKPDPVADVPDDLENAPDIAF